MFISRRLIVAASAIALLAGCASPNPYDNQGQASSGMSNTAKYGGLGALAGAVAGAAIDHNNRGKGALIGAAVAGLGAAGYGYYADKQEAALRASMANTGVEVQRQGDNITLNLPDGITFDFNKTTLKPQFYGALNGVASTLAEYNQTMIEVVGHTDSIGSDAVNNRISKERADAVAAYLIAQGVQSARIETLGAGKNYPIASNDTEAGRAQNRRVEIRVIPLTQ